MRNFAGILFRVRLVVGVGEIVTLPLLEIQILWLSVFREFMVCIFTILIGSAASSSKGQLVNIQAFTCL